MFQILSDKPDSSVIAVRASGKLTHADYEEFIPLFEKKIEGTGKLRILFELHDFHGWDAKAMWDDIKFETKHCRQIEKCAVVGEKSWEAWLIRLCAPFYRGQVKYFDIKDEVEAWNWVQG